MAGYGYPEKSQLATLARSTTVTRRIATFSVFGALFRATALWGPHLPLACRVNWKWEITRRGSSERRARRRESGERERGSTMCTRERERSREGAEAPRPAACGIAKPAVSGRFVSLAPLCPLDRAQLEHVCDEVVPHLLLPHLPTAEPPLSSGRSEAIAICGCPPAAPRLVRVEQRLG